tara:strand:- start:1821 stop:2015 length:195 start_codon:yes stop_codon:yes gene_type:complete
MDPKTKKELKSMIADFAKMGKKLNSINQRERGKEFSQGQRHLKIANDSFREFFGSLKRLFITIK